MLFVTALLMLSLIDFQHYLLPDAITLPGIVTGVGATLMPGWPVTLLDSTLSAAVGYFAMMVLAKAAEAYYGEEALGQGDWKMVAMLGAFLGSTKLLLVVLVANAAGAAVGLLLVAALGEAGRQKLPLGSFLGASGILLVFI
jgi:leader peptidase (prepilin peptidase)/N-methyltransferase